MKTVLKFYANWCAPCKNMERDFLEFKQENPHVEIKSIDVDILPAVARKYGVRKIPTIIFLENGQDRLSYTSPSKRRHNYKIC